MAVDFNANPPKVADLVKSAKLVVISKQWCPFSQKAKDVIAKYVDEDHPEYRILEIEDFDHNPLIPDVSKYQDEIAALSGGSRTVPKVWLSGTMLGGGDEMQALHKNGKLRQMFIDAGMVPAADSKVLDSGFIDTNKSAMGQNVRYFHNGKKLSAESFLGSFFST